MLRNNVEGSANEGGYGQTSEACLEPVFGLLCRSTSRIAAAIRIASLNWRSIRERAPSKNLGLRCEKTLMYNFHGERNFTRLNAASSR